MAAALSDLSLRKLFEGPTKLVDPIDDDCKKPASIDLRIGNIEVVFNNVEGIIDLSQENIEARSSHQNFSSLDISPGKSKLVALGATINMPSDNVGLMVTRSSLNRLGISIATTVINPGYSGIMPVTIINFGDQTIRLSPGIRVAQLLVFSLTEMPSVDYRTLGSSKYSDEQASPSRLHMDEDLARLTKQVIEKTLGQTKYI